MVEVAPGNEKARYIRRLEALRAERASWVDHWRDASDNVLPRRGRFLMADRNKGDRRNGKIIDNTATIALRTLASGLMSGVTSPARPWFRLGTPDPMLAELAPVKSWLADVERLMREAFNRSNAYNALFSVYEELGVFGTAAMIVYENTDETSGAMFHCETLTAGEYFIAVGGGGRVDTLYREYSATVGQVVSEFGAGAGAGIDWSVISPAVKSLYDQGALDQWVDIVHVIEPNRGRDASKSSARHKRWRSVWFEKGGGDDTRLLRSSGFDEFPAMCPRWNLAGADIYGRSPAMDALGDTRQLQSMEREMGRAIMKMVSPPLQGPSQIIANAINQFPGGYTAVDAGPAGAGVRPLFDVQPRTMEFQQSMDFVRNRIRQALFADLWLIVTEMDRANITATEIDARREEKLLMLGPVLERLHHELLDPMIDRVFAIMLRRRALPPPPEELAGVDLRVEYISMLAQAQRSVAVAGIERIAGFVERLAQIRPDILDKLDFDQSLDEYGDALGVPARIVVADDVVAKIRAERAQKEAQAGQAEAMQRAAMTAKDAALAANSMAGADMDGNNALTGMLRGITG